MSHSSAIPTVYYLIFAFYEPFLCVSSLIGTFADPKKTHDFQAPWPDNVVPEGPLPHASLVTIQQLAIVCGLLGLVNHFLLSNARMYCHDLPALQERIAFSLLLPLLFGDVMHMWVTLYSLGLEPWLWSWMSWTTIAIGLSLMIPRICWHLGIGRYVDTRDGVRQFNTPPETLPMVSEKAGRS